MLGISTGGDEHSLIHFLRRLGGVLLYQNVAQRVKGGFSTRKKIKKQEKQRKKGGCLKRKQENPRKIRSCPKTKKIDKNNKNSKKNKQKRRIGM